MDEPLEMVVCMLATVSGGSASFIISHAGYDGSCCCEGNEEVAHFGAALLCFSWKTSYFFMVSSFITEWQRLQFAKQ